MKTKGVSNQRNSNPARGKRRDKFFLDDTKPEKKPQQKRNNPGSGGPPPPTKRGPGVKKTVAFKTKDGIDAGKTSGKKFKQKPNGWPQKGKQHAGKKQPAPPAPVEHKFHTKPEKINYCLAPERMEAQGRAIKQFEREEREQEQKQRKHDRAEKHKMMTKKTRKGQPVMQGRLELLYEKVKKVVGVQ